MKHSILVTTYATPRARSGNSVSVHTLVVEFDHHHLAEDAIARINHSARFMDPDLTQTAIHLSNPEPEEDFGLDTDGVTE